MVSLAQIWHNDTNKDGMAETITQRGKTWRLQYRQKGYPAVSLTFDTEAEAEAEAEKIKARRKLNIEEQDRSAQKKTLVELLDMYLKEITATKKGEKRENSRIEAWKKTALAKRFLNNIRTPDISDYVQERRKAGVADATIRLEVMLLSAVFKYARQQRAIKIDNPVTGMKLPNGSKSRDRRFRKYEADFLYIALEAINPLHRQLAEFAVETAMRQGEILALTWSDVGENNTIRIVADKAGGVNYWMPISTRAAAILAAVRPADDVDETYNHPIFQISQDRVSRAFREACAAGRAAYEKYTGKPAPPFLADIRFHDLRHEATSRLFEKGMSRAEVMTITRHKTLAMLDRYTHLDRSENSAIVRKLG